MIHRIDIENARLCNAVVHGNTVSLAGQKPDDGIECAEAQTAKVLRGINAIPAKASAETRHILSALVVLANIGDAPAINRASDAWVNRDHPPARAKMEGQRVVLGWQ
jgi:enamine deaminase RidA (YjgF/YER057c/UK114 family)